MKNNLFCTHLHQAFSFKTIYWAYSLTLLPSILNACWLSSELSLKLGILFLVVALQELFFYFTKLSPIYIGFSFLTSIYLAFLLPLNLPILTFILTPIFSLGLMRYIFGHSSYWLNPALAGFLFAFSLWPQVWLHLLPNSGNACLLTAYLSTYPLGERTPFLANLLNHSTFFKSLLINIPDAYLSLLEGQFIYNFISPLWVFLALVILWRRYIIKWSLSLAYFLSYFLLIYVFEGVFLTQKDYFCGDLLFYFLSPITLLCLFFLSTDNQASPVNLMDMIIQGILSGIFSFLCLFIWFSPWSAVFGLILAQICSPLFDLYKLSYRLARKKMERSLNLTSYTSSNKDGES